MKRTLLIYNILTKLFSPKKWPIIAFLVSASLLGGAYAFQYIGGLNPCQMCYWQRHAHKVILTASALTALAGVAKLSVNLQRIGLVLITLSFFASFALAFWHVGVEHLWWEGPKTCAVAAPMEGFTAGGILDALKQPMETPACSDIVWSMLGLSMAGWNAIISLLSAFISAAITIKGTRS